jgi:SAM-dependent methyltransferase
LWVSRPDESAQGDGLEVQVTNRLRLFAQRILPVSARRRIVRYTRWPPVGLVRFGDLRRLHPISPYWGSERGKPIDRHYIERFLAAHSSDIEGHVLEIGDNKYSRMFGGDRITKSDVLHIAESKSKVTIIGDLTCADRVPPDTFDCIILTQTLQFVYDVPAVVQTLHRILRPGGVVLVTIPGISKISRYDMDRWGHYWSFTTQSARRLFEIAFPADYVRVCAHGNVLAAISFLHGLAAGELSNEELGYQDPDYELLITIRAVKPEATS